MIEECRTTAELLTKAADLAARYKSDADLAKRNVEMQRRNTMAFKRERDELAEALDQLLDDMGDEGLSVCQAAKDQAKAALAKVRGENVE